MPEILVPATVFLFKCWLIAVMCQGLSAFSVLYHGFIIVQNRLLTCPVTNMWPVLHSHSNHCIYIMLLKAVVMFKTMLVSVFCFF